MLDPYHDPGSGSGPVGAIRVGEYKLIKGNPGKPDGWVPPDSVSNTELVHLEDINNINISSGNQPLSWSSEVNRAVTIGTTVELYEISTYYILQTLNLEKQLIPNSSLKMSAAAMNVF